MPEVKPVEGQVAGRYQPAPPYPLAPFQPPPPGWYPDPAGAHPLRFWNGWGWTPGVSDGVRVGEDWRQPAWGQSPGLSTGTAGMPPVPGGDPRVRLPRRALVLALGGIVIALILGVAGSVLAELLVPHSNLANLVISQAGLWAGLVGAVLIASKRYGSGNVWRDFGVRLEGHDSWRGLLISIGGRVAGLLLVVPLLMLNKKFEGSDLGAFSGAKGDPLLMAVLVVIALVGAPFVEELFFRGLLLRSLLPMCGTAGAIVVQAFIFGSLHLRPSYGLGNVSVFAAIAAMGVVQGIVAERYRRLGPGMVSHAFFNLVAVVALWH